MDFGGSELMSRRRRSTIDPVAESRRRRIEELALLGLVVTAVLLGYLALGR